MPETGERTRRRRRAPAAAKKSQESVEETTDTAGEAASDAADTAGGAAKDGQATVTGELKDTIRAAAIEVLRPVAQQATTSAAKFAMKKGPDLVKDKVMPKVADAGGVGELAKGAMDKGGGVASAVGGVAGKLTGKGGGGTSATGTGRGRRLPVQESVDVAVDLETAYDQWTQFEEFPRFMHRVEKIEQRDDTTLMWHENIWGVRRSWEAEIVEQIPLERIEWRSKGGPKVVGVVTFHRLSDNLTRIEVNMDFQPQGLFEKTASGFRMSRRALRSDLMRFKAYVEMKDDATGAWRGRIEEGEVVDEGDEGDEGEGEARFSKDDPEAEADEDYEGEEEDEDLEEEDEDLDEPEAEEDEEPEAEADEDEEPEAEAEEDEEPEEAPKPKARSRSRSRSTSASASNSRTKAKASAKPKPKPKPKRTTTRKRATARSS
jgi:uncharacterized membrane protein